MNGFSAARLAALASSLGSADLALALALPVAAVGARFGSGAGFAAGLIAGAVQGALWVARGPGGSPASPALAILLRAVCHGGHRTTHAIDCATGARQIR